MQVNKWKVSYKCHIKKDGTHIVLILCEGKMEGYDLYEINKRWYMSMMCPQIQGR